MKVTKTVAKNSPLYPTSEFSSIFYIYFYNTHINWELRKNENWEWGVRVSSKSRSYYYNIKCVCVLELLIFIFFVFYYKLMLKLNVERWKTLWSYVWRLKVSPTGIWIRIESNRFSNHRGGFIRDLNALLLNWNCNSNWKLTWFWLLSLSLLISYSYSIETVSTPYNKKSLWCDMIWYVYLYLITYYNTNMYKKGIITKQ